MLGGVFKTATSRSISAISFGINVLRSVWIAPDTMSATVSASASVTPYFSIIGFMNTSNLSQAELDIDDITLEESSNADMVHVYVIACDMM